MDSHWQPWMQYKKLSQILTSASQILLDRAATKGGS